MTDRHMTEAFLRRLAGDKAYARGEAYARKGAVELDHQDDQRIVASVQGTQAYRVQWRWRAGRWQGACDCPVGDEGRCCKHQVAAALVASGVVVAEQEIEANDSVEGPRRRTRPSGMSDDDVLQAWLGDLDPEALRALVRDLAGRDRDAWRQLVARARFAKAPPETWRKTIGDLIGRKRFLDYHACRTYARRLAALLDIVRTALVRDPVAAHDLAEYALSRLFSVYEAADDSTGALGEVLHELGDLHRQAVPAASIEPMGLAKRYFKLALLDGWGVIGGVDDVADALGRKGCAALERLAQERLAGLPAPSGRHGWDEHAGERYKLDRVLVALARHGGDVDAVIAIKARAIQGSADYLGLAGFCREHGRSRLATDWLERGLKAHPKDGRLLDALAQVHHQEGFPEDALALRWRAFQASPGEPTYLALQEAACGLAAWSVWRPRALAHVAQLTSSHPVAGNDLLVALMLAEGNVAEAWRIASDGRLSAHTWARLAPALEEAGEPESALRAYRTLVQFEVDCAQPAAYARAVEWLRRMRLLHARLGTEHVLADYLDTLRATHRAKRRLMAMLDEFSSGADSRGR